MTKSNKVYKYPVCATWIDKHANKEFQYIAVVKIYGKASTDSAGRRGNTIRSRKNPDTAMGAAGATATW